MIVLKIEPYKSKYELKYTKWLFKSVIVYLIVTPNTWITVAILELIQA